MGRLIHFDSDQRRKMIALYQDGATLMVVAEKFSVSHPVVSRVLRQENIPVRLGGPRRILTSEQEAGIVRSYKDGKKLQAIAEECNCSIEPIKRVLTEAGLRPREIRGGLSAVTLQKRAEIVQRYRNDETRHSISKRMKLWPFTVDAVLREEGIELRDDRRRRGPQSPLFKDGRCTNEQGYIHIYVAGDSPFASMRNGNHVLEHRLVMAGHLSRPLLPHERVHHRNGVKDDNRIENLELWQNSHPPGQRSHESIPHCATCTCAHALGSVVTV